MFYPLQQSNSNPFDYAHDDEHPDLDEEAHLLLDGATDDKPADGEEFEKVILKGQLQYAVL